MYIRTTATLDDFCMQARLEGRLALDLEFIREHSYAPRLALIQVAIQGTCAIIDPLEISDLSSLLAVVSSPVVLKILHAAAQDLEVLHWHAGSVPKQVFDTQMAAAMAGLGEQLAYGRLVEQLLGVTLLKGESYSDWLQRPLEPSQEAYALDDVRYLLDLHTLLSRRLQELGRADWVAEECHKLTNPALYERDPRMLYRRIRRADTLSSQGLAILRELADWREQEARQRDRPLGSVLQDPILVDLARKAPRTLSDLQRMRGFPVREVERAGAALLGAIERGLAVAESDRPQLWRDHKPSPAEETLVRFLDVCLKTLCQQQKLPSTFVASRSDLETLVRRYRQGRLATEGSPLLEGWRGNLVGQEVLAILDGRVNMHLQAKTGQIKFTPRRS